MAYDVKMLLKKEGRDFTVPKLEGLWWVEEDKLWYEIPKEELRWKFLIRQPKFISSEIIEDARQEVIKKKRINLVNEVKFEKMKEGKCVQILQIGPYSTESESLAKMQKLMEEKNLVKNGLHHEIYLSDPRKTPSQKLKTILKQPVKERR